MNELSPERIAYLGRMKARADAGIHVLTDDEVSDIEILFRPSSYLLDLKFKPAKNDTYTYKPEQPLNALPQRGSCSLRPNPTNHPRSNRND